MTISQRSVTFGSYFSFDKEYASRLEGFHDYPNKPIKRLRLMLKTDLNGLSKIGQDTIFISNDALPIIATGSGDRGSLDAELYTHRHIFDDQRLSPEEKSSILVKKSAPDPFAASNNTASGAFIRGKNGTLVKRCNRDKTVDYLFFNNTNKLDTTIRIDKKGNVETKQLQAEKKPITPKTRDGKALQQCFEKYIKQAADNKNPLQPHITFNQLPAVN